MSEEHIALYYCEGKSDKEYHVHLLKKGNGYITQIEYGRKGSSLTVAIKTPTPVSLAEATEIFDDCVHAKKLKGYTEAPGEVPYVGSDKEGRITGVLPQLLNNVEEEKLESLFKDDNYCMQEKKDGKRILLRRNKEVEAINRKGLLVGFPTELEESASVGMAKRYTIDGELIGERFWAFDILEFKGEDLKNRPYNDRYGILDDLFFGNTLEIGSLSIVPTFWTESEKRENFKLLKEAGAEGVVFKLIDSVYKPGRPSSGGTQLKFKFVQMATCEVLGPGPKGKRSVEIGVLGKGGEIVNVGRVTILPNFPVPKVRAFVEVKYLYYNPGGALYQPIYLGEREDKNEPDKISSLKAKQVIEEE